MHKTSPRDVYFMNKTQIAAQYSTKFREDKEICAVLNNKISCIIYDRKEREHMSAQARNIK